MNNAKSKITEIGPFRVGEENENSHKKLCSMLTDQSQSVFNVHSTRNMENVGDKIF